MRQWWVRDNGKRLIKIKIDDNCLFREFKECVFVVFTICIISRCSRELQRLQFIKALLNEIVLFCRDDIQSHTKNEERKVLSLILLLTFVYNQSPITGNDVFVLFVLFFSGVFDIFRVKFLHVFHSQSKIIISAIFGRKIYYAASLSSATLLAFSFQ